MKSVHDKSSTMMTVVGGPGTTGAHFGPRDYVDAKAVLAKAAAPSAKGPKEGDAPSAAWKDESPSASPSEGTCVFLQGLRPAVTLAQVFGLLPVRKPSSDEEATFSWRSLRVAFSLFIILGSFFETVLALIRVLETGFTFYSSVNVIFYSTSMVGSIIFLRLGIKWQQMISYWGQLERYFTLTHGNPARLGLHMVTTTVVVLVLALVEHLLSVASTFAYVWVCYDRGGIPLLLQGYFLTKYRKVFSMVAFSAWKALVVLMLQFITVFVWNFVDLFIILISMGLVARFRQLNRALIIAKGKVKPDDFWRQKREAYNALSKLTRTIDSNVGPVVVLSYASNLYFICLQLLVVTKNPIHLTPWHDAYFFFSLIYLIIRTCLMSLVAADIAEESQKPKQVLFSVPSSSYCLEVQRFLTQVNTDDIALTGCNFFSITRSFMLTVAGTIVTYLVILVQFEDTSSDPDSAQSNNTITCTCSDWKGFPC